jgi:hypothetical protein
VLNESNKKAPSSAHLATAVTGACLWRVPILLGTKQLEKIKKMKASIFVIIILIVCSCNENSVKSSGLECIKGIWISFEDGQYIEYHIDSTSIVPFLEQTLRGPAMDYEYSNRTIVLIGSDTVWAKVIGCDFLNLQMSFNGEIQEFRRYSPSDLTFLQQGLLDSLNLDVNYKFTERIKEFKMRNGIEDNHLSLEDSIVFFEEIKAEY